MLVVLPLVLVHAALHWPCDGPLAANPPTLWGNGQIFASGAVGDDVASSVFVGEKVGHCIYSLHMAGCPACCGFKCLSVLDGQHVSSV
jgi:hypothetical protein